MSIVGTGSTIGATPSGAGMVSEGIVVTVSMTGVVFAVLIEVSTATSVTVDDVTSVVSSVFCKIAGLVVSVT